MIPKFILYSLDINENFFLSNDGWGDRKRNKFVWNYQKLPATDIGPKTVVNSSPSRHQEACRGSTLSQITRRKRGGRGRKKDFNNFNNTWTGNGRVIKIISLISFYPFLYLTIRRNQCLFVGNLSQCNVQMFTHPPKRWSNNEGKWGKIFLYPDVAKNLIILCI